MLRKLRRAFRQDDGQALVLFAAGLVVFLGFVGMSIDVGRFVWARTQMQSAVDAAALAAAQSLPDKADAGEKANTYWLDNSSFIRNQGENVLFAVTYPPGNKRVAVEASADIPTWFAKFFGVDEWHVSAEGDAESIVIDAMLVMDRSGSMCWDNYGPSGNYTSRIRLDENIDNKSTTKTFKVRKDVSDVPLSSYVWVGQVFRVDNEWMKVTAINDTDNRLTVDRGVNNPNTGGSSSRASHSRNARPYGNTCQQAGARPYYPWEYIKTGSVTFINAFNGEYDRIGYNDFATRGIYRSGLTGAFGTLKSAVTGSPDPTAGSNPNGDDDSQYTNIAHGMLLGTTELVNEGRDNARWAMVLLSDGVANTYCTSSTSLTCDSISQNNTTARSRVISQAQLAKNNGITVYTISYGAASDDDLMEEVAEITGGKFYDAPTPEQLTEAFISISKETHIRLAR